VGNEPFSTPLGCLLPTSQAAQTGPKHYSASLGRNRILRIAGAIVMSLAKHLDKLGILGSFIAAACCLGLPAMISIIAALGLGFLINDVVLLPLLIGFLVLTLFGLFQGFKRHKRIWPLVVGVVSALAVVVFIFVSFSTPLAYAAVAGLVASSLLNVLAQRLAHAS